MNEWINEWMNACMKDWINELSNVGLNEQIIGGFPRTQKCCTVVRKYEWDHTIAWSEKMLFQQLKIQRSQKSRAAL